MIEARSDDSSRLDALEMRIAHQDRTIAEINEVITSQWRTIDALQRLVTELREEFRNIAPTRSTPEPAPPHY
jgi:SlyX protein